MPEFYDQGNCRYQLAAQPYLAAIARGIRDKPASRAFLLKGTEYEQSYAGAKPLWQEQWKKRDSNRFHEVPILVELLERALPVLRLSHRQLSLHGD